MITRKHYRITGTLIILLLTACSKPPAEQAIRQNIEEIQTAIEEKSSRSVLAHLSEYFTINDRIDKKGTRGLLAGNFIRHKNIRIAISNIEVSINEIDPMRATSTATVVLVGAQNILPDSGRVYQVEGEWQIDNSDWLLMKLSWN